MYRMLLRFCVQLGTTNLPPARILVNSVAERVKERELQRVQQRKPMLFEFRMLKSSGSECESQMVVIS